MSDKIVLDYSTSEGDAIRKLKRIVQKLGATNLDYDHRYSRLESEAWASFDYKGETYRFHYSTEKAKRNNVEIRKNSDLFLAVVFAIEDISRPAIRGVFPLGTVAAGFKQIPFIEVPSWAKFMGFNTRPINYQQVDQRFRELAKGSMRPESNPEDFIKLKEALDLAKQYFNVK